MVDYTSFLSAPALWRLLARSTGNTGVGTTLEGSMMMTTTYTGRRSGLRLAGLLAAGSAPAFDRYRSGAGLSRTARYASSPFAAGGSIDQLARIIADKLSDTLGKRFLVDNVPGAGGNIGMGQVARSAPRRLHRWRWSVPALWLIRALCQGPL